MIDLSKLRLHVEETSAEDAQLATETAGPLTTDAQAQMPAFVMLNGMSSVKNQGQGPYCASFATAALLEFKFPDKDMAECSLIKNAQPQSIGKLMNYAMQRGVCQERQWPYDLAHADKKPCADRGGGSSFCFEKTYLVFQETALAATPAAGFGPKSDLVRRHLATVASPVCLDVPALFKTADWDCGWEGGDVVYPQMLNRDKALKWAEANQRWHAVAIYGYDDAKRRFVFKNSWGTAWGRGGHGTMSYLYVDQLSRIGMAGG